MATINLGNASPPQEIRQLDLKHPAIQIKSVPLDTLALTPAGTPEDASPADDEPMVGKKIYSMGRPDDRAKSLASKLTLEEQVRIAGEKEEEKQDQTSSVHPVGVLEAANPAFLWWDTGSQNVALPSAGSGCHGTSVDICKSVADGSSCVVKTRLTPFLDLAACRRRFLADSGYSRKGHSFNQDVRRAQWRSWRVLY